MSKTLIYAGIGSRNTPEYVLEQMCLIGQQLADKWILRSGHADGADTAFEMGCIHNHGKKEIFIPWFGFNGAPNNEEYIRPKATQELADFASNFHPAWSSCSDTVKLMHMRNCCQILGRHGDAPVDMVICWTKEGKRGGGTGQALRIAEHFYIPIFDLAVEGAAQKLCSFVERSEHLAGLI